jgi:hypothetical protein
MIKSTQCEDVDWSHLAQFKIHGEEPYGFIKDGKFLATMSFARRVMHIRL